MTPVTMSILSKREMKILELIAKGYTSEKIGKILFIAESTVQTHRRNMLKKTETINVQEMLGWACKNHLLKI
jgi:DNA-binding CsgD family transcriptional regulator